MAIFIDDEKVDALAERYQAIINANSKQDAVRHALEKVLDTASQTRSTWSKVVEIQRSLRDASPLDHPLPYNKEFLNSLYEDGQ